MAEEAGISVDLLDLRTLAPIDTESVVESVRNTGRLLIVDEAPRTGSVSAEIAARTFEHVYDYLDAPVTRVTSPDVPVPASPVLEDAVIPNRTRIANAAVQLVEQR